MASLPILATTALPKCGKMGAVVLRTQWSSRGFLLVTRQQFQATAQNDASNAYEKASQVTNKGVNEAKNIGQDVQNKASYAAENASNKAKEVAREATKVAQDVTEKAKQTMQDAWGSLKDITQKIKDSIIGKAEESKEFVKENVESVKRSMNTKN